MSDEVVFITFAIVGFLVICGLDHYLRGAEKRKQIALAAAQDATEKLKKQILDVLFPKKQHGKDIAENEEDKNDRVKLVDDSDNTYETCENPLQNDERAVEQGESINEDGDTCAVCIEPFLKEDSIIVGYSCKHKFHRSCMMTTWFKKRSDCPVCREDMWSDEEYLKAKLEVLKENPDDVEEAIHNRSSNSC